MNCELWQGRCVAIVWGVLFLLVLASCGGGSSDSASASQGVFLDSAVDGIRFETATQSGTTDENGTFRYMPGETVAFYIGDILLGSAAGAATLTPVDLVSGAADETNEQVTNILRFLQALDSDADASSGIQISSAVSTAMTGQALNFAQAMMDFETDFNALSNAMLGGVGLVSVIEAQAHMRTTLDDMTMASDGEGSTVEEDYSTGGGGGGGGQGLGNVSVAGVDTSIIGLSFDPDTATPFFTDTTASVAWMGGNTNTGNVSRLGGLNVSTINGQISLLQYDIQDYRSTPLLSYGYSLSCWPVVAAECSKISFDTSSKRLVLSNVVLMNRTAVVFDSQATGPVTLNGTLYWE